MSYQAFITKVELTKHPNADRLQIGRVLGEQVVTGLETQEGFVIYFPENGQLSEEYCVANDLYPRFDETGERVGGGYIDPKSRRVRAQNFRGEKSYGLIMPLSSLEYTGVLPEVLIRNTEKSTSKGDIYSFDAIGKHEICRKFGRPHTETVGKNKAKWYTIRALRKLWLKLRVLWNGETVDGSLNGLFPKLPDTPNLYHQNPEYLPKEPVIVTEKIHGTSFRWARVPKVYRGVKGMIQRLKDRRLGDNLTDFFVGSRRIIVDAGYIGYYGDGMSDGQWRSSAAAPFEPYIKLGEVIYGEMAGYLPNTQPIMPPHNPAKVTQDTDFKKRAKHYAKSIVYHYGSKGGECSLHVYRIDYQGKTLTFDDMVNRCNELWRLSGSKIETVPLLHHLGVSDNQWLVNYAKELSEGDSTLGNHPREGVVLRYDTPTGLKVYKAKSHSFLIMEGIANEEVGNIEDEA